MIAVIIITAAILFYIRNVSNIGDPDLRELEQISFEAEKISSSFLSIGSPSDWNNVTVTRIGLTDGENVLDLAKLAALNTLDYKSSRGILGTKYEYFAFFTNSTGHVLNLDGCGYGSPSVSISNISADECEPVNASLIDADKLANRQRILVHNNQLINLKVLVWN